MKHCSFLEAKNLTSNTLHLYPCLRFFFLDLIWTLLLCFNFYYGKLPTHAKVRELYTADHFNSDPRMTSWSGSVVSCVPPPRTIFKQTTGIATFCLSILHFVCPFFIWSFSVDLALLFFFKVTIFYVSEICALWKFKLMKCYIAIKIIFLDGKLAFIV